MNRTEYEVISSTGQPLYTSRDLDGSRPPSAGGVMSAMSELHAAKALIDQLDEGPTAPQEPPPGTPQRIVYHDGHIWRRSDNRWDTMEPADPHVLLDLY